jgi:hypothetical protein
MDAGDGGMAIALIFPLCIAGVSGILAACSTVDSDSILRRHLTSIELDDGIAAANPAWLYFEC